MYFTKVLGLMSRLAEGEHLAGVQVVVLREVVVESVRRIKRDAAIGSVHRGHAQPHIAGSVVPVKAESELAQRCVHDVLLVERIGGIPMAQLTHAGTVDGNAGAQSERQLAVLACTEVIGVVTAQVQVAAHADSIMHQREAKAHLVVHERTVDGEHAGARAPSTCIHWLRCSRLLLV